MQNLRCLKKNFVIDMLRPLFCSALLLLLLFSDILVAETKLHVTFKLLENLKDDTFKAQLIIDNRSLETLENWRLHFNFVRPILQLDGAQIVQDDKRMGDYYQIVGDKAHRNLKAGEKLTVQLLGKWFIKHYSDAPDGYFLEYESEGRQQGPEAVQAEALILENWQAEQSELSRQMQYERTAIEGNQIVATSQDVSIIPTPVSWSSLEAADFQLKASHVISVLAEESSGASEAAQFLSQQIAAATGFSLKVKKLSKPLTELNGIVLSTENTEHLLKAESYELSIDSQAILLRAKDPAGFHYGIQTIRQLLPASIYAATLQKGIDWKIPAVHILDYPRFAYRGLHLDVARNFFPVSDVKRLIDLMAIHKLNYFHWHLTDDEGWRIEIKKYPQLTKVGAWRGHKHPIAPALGSGPQLSGGFYTQEQIKEVIDYAAKRQIEVIPEIDIPGHARALIKSLPELLVDKDDKSEYESVQGYRDNVLSACLPATYEVLENIIHEVSQLFPSEYIHIGSDEVPDGVWDPKKSPRCRQWMADKKLNDKQQLQNDFVKRIKAMVEKRGKKLAGWEEVTVGGGFADKNLLVYAWTKEEAGRKLVEEGYEVILTPASYLYFDLAYNEDPKEPGYYWAGTVDSFKAYSFVPVPNDLTTKQKKLIRGVQASLWSETIRTRADLDYKAFPRLAALSELAWSPAARRNWKDFSRRLEEFYLAKLEQYGVKFRKPATSQQLGATDGSTEKRAW